MPETKFWIEQFIVLVVFGVPGGLLVIWLYARLERWRNERTERSRAERKAFVDSLASSDALLRLEMAREVRFRFQAVVQLIMAAVFTGMALMPQPADLQWVVNVVGVFFVLAMATFMYLWSRAIKSGVDTRAALRVLAKWEEENTGRLRRPPLAPSAEPPRRETP